MAEIALQTITSGSGGGGLLSQVLTQDVTVLAGNNTITVTPNGGVLPVTDSHIRLATATGPLFQGGGNGEYTISRAAVPNTLVLNTAPLANLRFLLQLIYP